MQTNSFSWLYIRFCYYTQKRIIDEETKTKIFFVVQIAEVLFFFRYVDQHNNTEPQTWFISCNTNSEKQLDELIGITAKYTVSKWGIVFSLHVINSLKWVRLYRANGGSSCPFNNNNHNMSSQYGRRDYALWLNILYGDGRQNKRATI